MHLHNSYSSDKHWNRFLLLPEDCRGAESDSGRSLPPAQNHVIGGELCYRFYFTFNRLGTTVDEPWRASLYCPLSSVQQQSSTVCCPSLSGHCLSQERSSSYWACSGNPLYQQETRAGLSYTHNDNADHRITPPPPHPNKNKSLNVGLLTFRRRFLYAAAVAVVAAAHWSSYRRALTLTREAITSLQNAHQVLSCRGREI